MNGPDKPTAKLESLIDLGDKIIAELKALTDWKTSKSESHMDAHEADSKEGSHETHPPD